MQSLVVAIVPVAWLIGDNDLGNLILQLDHQVYCDSWFSHDHDENLLWLSIVIG